jgi:DNA-binding NtrC family response regulator
MTAKARILVVDDDPLVRRSCERILGEAYDVHMAESGHAGLAALESATAFDLALVDLKLPDLDGMEILRRAPDRFPEVPLIIITGYSTIRNAVQAIKMGAFDYVAKPFSPDELEAAVEKALREHKLRRDFRGLQEALADRYRLLRLVGESPGMKHVFSLVEQVAPTDSTVLVTGESGTGKELVARAIHFSSLRKDRPFVAIDCGAIAPNLIASELFGHVRGAFTGAVDDRQGLLKAADGGTLFLDEVSNLPPDLQAALLRVVETQEVRPVGSSGSAKVDVRFVAATNEDLATRVADGKFRQDLYYRFNVFPIRLPPLRERREDIPLLARHFLSLFSARSHKRIEDFTPEAMDALTRYDWPGNVRELSNVVERLVILCGAGPIGQVHVRDSMHVALGVPEIPQTAEELNELKKKLRDQTVAEVEKAFLLEALRRSGYNITRAAEQTGMQRTHFQALLKKQGIRLRDLIGHDDESHPAT